MARKTKAQLAHELGMDGTRRFDASSRALARGDYAEAWHEIVAAHDRFTRADAAVPRRHKMAAQIGEWLAAVQLRIYEMADVPPSSEIPAEFVELYEAQGGVPEPGYREARHLRLIQGGRTDDNPAPEFGNDPFSPFRTWRSLAAVQKETAKQFGPDARFFYFYKSAHGWTRSLALPRGGVVTPKPDRLGRGVVQIDPARRRRAPPPDARDLLRFKKAPGYLYHLTSAPSYLGIRRTGLRAGVVPGIGTAIPEGGYEAHSQGGVFLTDAAGLPYWLDNQTVKENEQVLLRVRDPKCSVDKPGTADVRRALRNKATAFKCTDAVSPENLEVWDASGKRWRPVAEVELVTMAETIRAPDGNPGSALRADLLTY